MVIKTIEWLAAAIAISFCSMASAATVDDDDSLVPWLIPALRPTCAGLSAAPATIAVGAPNGVTLTANGCSSSTSAYDWYLNGIKVGTTTTATFTANAPASLGQSQYAVVARRVNIPSVQYIATVTAVTNGAPTASISGPADGSSGLNGIAGFPTTISISAQDAQNNLSSASLSVNGTTVGTWSTGQSTFSQSVPYNFATSGTYVIALTATDSLGLQTSQTAVFTSLKNVSIAPPALNTVAGTTDGSLAISPSGAATYSIPISAAPGVNGLTPALTLNYSSQARDGLLGYGWSLGGLSMITRCPQTFAQDGAAVGVTFSSSDRFCLDGKRLVLVQGSAPWGTDRSEYRTEVDEFSRIVAYYPNGCAQGTCWNGIGYFKVWTKAGLILYYGFDNSLNTTQDAVIRRWSGYAGDTAIAWALFRVEDRRGNYMTVTYSRDTAQPNPDGSTSDINHRPAQITYVGAGSNKIVFGYDSARPDPRRGYLHGAKTDNNYRLTTITSYTNTSTVAREYRLGYTTSPVGRSLLSTITECDGTNGGGTCLPATQFGWYARSTANNQFNATPWTGPTPPNLPGSPTVNDVRARVASGDFDGDGRTDFIVSDGSTGWKVCRSNGVSVFTCNTAGGMAPFVSTKTQSALFGDFNGDGRTDIAIPPVGDGSGFGSWSICLSTSTLDTFSCSSVSNAPTASSTRTGYYGLNIEDYLVGDFVGDGKDHIVMPDGGSAGNVCTWLSTVAPFSCQSQFANVGSAKSTTDYDEGTGYRRDAIVGDLNGDGRLDIVGVQTRPAQIPLQPFASIVSSSGFATSFAWDSGLGTTGQTIPAPPWDIGASVTGDLHGSGYSDLVLYFLNTSTQTSDTYICRSTGVAPFDCSGRFTRYPDNQVYNVVHVADFDGDGRPDVLVGINRSLTPLYAVCQVYGDHYNDQPCPQWSTAAFANSELGPIFGDFDGDGLTDLLTYNTSSGQWTVYKAAAAPQDVLNTVTDGYGRITTITYKSLNDSATYTPEYSASYPQRNVNAGLWVVSQVSVDNGVGGNFVTNYHYRGYQVDAKGRGSLGFHVVDATDQTSSIKTTTTYRQDFPYTGMVSSVASVYQLGSMPTLRQSTNTFALGPASGGSGSYNGTAPYYAQFPFVQTTSEMVNDLDGSQIATISSNFGYDSNGYGNLTTSSVTTTANSEQYLSSSSYTYQAAIVDSVAITNPRWVVNLLSELQVRKTSPTSDKTRTTDFTYDLTYFDLATQIIEPYDATSDHAYKLTTVFGRDSYGNVNSRTLQWKDATGIDKSRVVEQLDFTATSGRYPRTIKNAPPFSQTETRYYDDRTGKPTQITAIDGVTTTWTYDGFGRVASETHADQTITGYKYVKCNSGIDPDCTVRGITGTAAVIADTTSLAITGSPRVQVPSMRVLDRLGREILTKTWSFDGTKVLAERTYDGQGYLHSVARPHKTTESPVDTTYAYDNLGRVTAVTYPTDTGFTSDSMSYTANTKTTNLSTGGQRVELSNGLDKLARVTERITGSPVTTTKIDYAYDGFGNLAQTTDQNAVPVIVTYDLLGRKTGLNDRDLGNVTYKVNALGLTWQQTDAKGQVSQFTFDELNRMTDRVESGANTGHWTYDTNLAGHLATATTTNYSRTHYYDSVGRLSQLVTSITDATYGTQAFTSTYRYDAYGRKQSATHQHSSSQHAPVVVGYGYNLQGMLYQLAGTDASYWTVNQRDAVDHVTQETLGNGLITNRGYFSNSARLSTTQTGPSGSVQSDSYSYDVVGRLGQRSNKVGPNAAVSETFSYDLINRLTSSTIGSTTKTYGYDATGNITSKTGVGTYSYGQLGGCNPATARPHAVTGITGTINTTFCYDANGNLTSGNGLTISWTAFNQPTQVYKDGAHYDQFAYGPEHQRVTHLQLNGTSNQTFFYAGAMDLVGGTPGTLRTYLPFSLGVVVDTGSGTRAVSYFHRDHLGSTEAISNAAGNYVEGFSYDPWGKRRNLDGSDAASITANNDRYGYTGQEMLDGTGLVHLNGRVYDPLLGKFQAADPYVDRWSETQGHNRFTYALNSATNTTDSTGYVALKLNDSARFPSLKDQEVEFPPVTVTGRSSLGAFMLSLSNRVYLRPMAERMVRRAAIGVAVPAAGFVVGTVCKGMAAVGCGAAALAGAYYIANNREKVYDLLRPIISENGEDQGQNGSDGLSKDKGASVEKPKGIPDNWREEPTRGEGGRQWVNPDNPGDRVRVMPGNPDSPNPGQREPYVRDVRNGNQWLDVNGNRVEGSEGRNSPSTHIPLSDYVFRP